MFLTERVPALFKKGTLKLQKTEHGFRRVAEATLLIEPFPCALARELGDEIASHLFTDDDMIRLELEAIDLRVRAGLQRITVRHDESMRPLVVLEDVSIKDIQAVVQEDEKSNRRWIGFSFVLVFSLENKDARNFVLDEFGKSLLYSFESQQRDLLQKAELHEAIAAIVPDGTTVSFGASGGEMREIDAAAHLATAAGLRNKARSH